MVAIILWFTIPYGNLFAKSALPSAQKKNPITGEDGDLPFHLKKLRVIIQQNQEIDSVNPTWRW